MIKSKSYHLITLLLGIVLLIASLLCRLKGINNLLSLQQLKAISGILLGVGAGLIGMSISNLIMNCMLEKDPLLKRKNEIEYKDERNISIRNHAKAKSADIIQWFIMGIAYLTILIGTPLWVTLIIVVVFTLYHILTAYFTLKYQNEM